VEMKKHVGLLVTIVMYDLGVDDFRVIVCQNECSHSHVLLGEHSSLM